MQVKVQQGNEEKCTTIKYISAYKVIVNVLYMDLMQNMTMDLLGSSWDHSFYDPSKGPRIGTKIQFLIMGLQEGPHRSMKDHIGTMVMFYIRSDNLVNKSVEKSPLSTVLVFFPALLITKKSVPILRIQQGLQGYRSIINSLLEIRSFFVG